MKATQVSNMLRSLFPYEGIQTTLAKAKFLRPVAEHLVTMAKRGNLASHRHILKTVPHPVAVKKLIDTIAPRYEQRQGGYLRIIRAGWRKGDGAPVALIEFVDRPKREKKPKKVKAEAEPQAVEAAAT